MKKISLTALTVLILSGCSAGHSGFESYPMNDLKNQEIITQQYHINTEWWKQYHQEDLNQLIEIAINNNLDFAAGKIKVNQALYQANLSGADLIPTLSGSLSGSTSKNIKTGGNSTQSFNGGIDLSYTVDLWGKLSDAAKEKEYEYKATQEDLDVIKLTLINNTVNGYFDLKYLNEKRNIEISNLENYKKLYEITSNKSKYGIISDLDVVQAQQSITSSENEINSIDLQIKTIQQTLRNILNYSPSTPININNTSLLDIKLNGVDMNVPVSTIANRPDIKALEYRLKSSFKNKTAIEKDIYPDITISSGLSSSSNKFNNTFNMPVASGGVSISLPFLDWDHVKWNVKTSQSEFEASKISFEQGVTEALNDIDVYYYTYKNYQYNYKNINQQYINDKKITGYYQARYASGISEMSDLLSAIQTENNAKESIIQAKYQLLTSESDIYKAMAGQYIKNK